MSTPFDLPTDLKQWDYETVYRLVSGEAYEPGLFDFKDTLKAKGSEEGEREHLRNMRKVIGSMANTITGGFIIFGVLDRSRHPNKTATHGSLIFRGVLKNPRTGWNKWLERTPAKPALVAEGQKEQ